MASYKKLTCQLLLVAILAVAAGKGTALLYHSVNADKAQGIAEITPPPTLIIPDQELDLGRVYETDSFEHVFHITNRGDQPITITGFEKDCDCVQITPWSDVVLEPSATHSFAMKLSLRERFKNPWSPQVSAFSIAFGAIYALEGRRQKAEWNVRGLRVPTIQLNPTALHFGVWSNREPPFEAVIDIAAAEEIAEVDCTAPPQWSVRATRPDNPSSPNGFQVVARYCERPAPRKVTDTIRLTPVTMTGDRLPAKEFRIEGEISRDVVAHPLEIQIGRRPVGATVEEAAALRSLTNRRFHVKRVSGGCKDLDIVPTGGEDGHEYMFRLRVAKPGDQELSAEFAIQDDEGPEFVVVVPIRYHGTEQRSERKGEVP
jgi:hypothetical protein